MRAARLWSKALPYGTYVRSTGTVQLCSCTLYARNARLAKNVQRSFNEICDSRFEWTLPVFFVPVAHHHGLKIVVAEKERANSC